MSLDVNALRAQFPVLHQEINGKPLVYLDNAATTQKPQVVIDAVSEYYRTVNSNVHRAAHYLSDHATASFEAARADLAAFINAAREEVILTKGTTEGINLVAQCLGRERLQAGDEILITALEHHANIVPWHFLRERQGVKLVWVEPEADGSLDPARVLAAITPKTKLVAVTHMSNVLGTVVDIKTIAAGCRARGVPILADGSQSAVHMPVDVQDLGVDFYPITGHKLYGPSGSGAIYITRERQAEMRPFIGGGDMIKEVTRDDVIYNDPPHKFEAGTPGIVQQIGLGVALDYMMGLGMETIAAHERALASYARERLKGLNWLNVQGDAPGKGGIFSFTMNNGAHAHDISTVLDKKGVAVRAGQHCTGPLMEHLGINASCRASFALYNTEAEVDALIEALEFCHDLFG